MHQIDELSLSRLDSYTRIVLLLLADRRDDHPRIVMSGIDESLIWILIEPLDTRIFFLRGSLLKVGPTCPSDEEDISREETILDSISRTSVRMSWSREDFDLDRSDRDSISIREEEIRMSCYRTRSHTDLSSCLLTKSPTPRDMIRMDMSIEDMSESISELIDQLKISIDTIQHWIDDEHLSRLGISDEIGVGRALWIEELTEEKWESIHKG